jgi:hypothetical protein
MHTARPGLYALAFELLNALPQQFSTFALSDRKWKQSIA